MAKDPAFLFYPGDYVTGTMHLDFECKGAYIDLLMLQFNKGHMTLDMIKHMLGHKFEHIWAQIEDKFKTDGKYYWNARLKSEKEKRVKYSESRQNNRNSKKENQQHMYQHMEDTNVNGNTNKYKGVQGGKINPMKGVEFSEDKSGVFFEDGSFQKLGEFQKEAIGLKKLIPNAVIKGQIY